MLLPFYRLAWKISAVSASTGFLACQGGQYFVKYTILRFLTFIHLPFSVRLVDHFVASLYEGHFMLYSKEQSK